MKYEFEITHTITIARTVVVEADDEGLAEGVVQAGIASGKYGLNKIDVQAPDQWASESETEATCL